MSASITYYINLSLIIFQKCLLMQIGELAGLAVGSTVLLNVMFAGY
jgi:hypothetical protein